MGKPNISAAGKVAIKLVGAALVVVAFVIIVLTAVAQQEVIVVLAKDHPDMGYSSAYAAFNAIDGRNTDLRNLRKEEAQDLSQLRTADARVETAKSQFEDDWSDFFPLAAQIQQSEKCNLRFDETGKVSLRLIEWQDARRCSATGLLPPPVNQKFTAFENGSGNLDRAASNLSRAIYDDQDLRNNLTSVQAGIKAATFSPDEQKTMQIFSETDVLRKNQMLGGSTLLQFPPPMLQILLAFASGAFGALLITLILVVYPNTGLTLAGSATVGPRIMLGGMIAMCVYIVLLGGTSVLGASPGITAAGTNYMAFCAIAILAGMFSDRVAFWLSDRANAFFKAGGVTTSGGTGGGTAATGGSATGGKAATGGLSMGGGGATAGGTAKPTGTDKQDGTAQPGGSAKHSDTAKASGTASPVDAATATTDGGATPTDEGQTDAKAS